LLPAGLIIGLGVALGACRQKSTPPAAPPPPPAPKAQAPDPLAGVVDPFTFAHAAGATPRDRAIEDIGPYELIDGRPQSPNARYWTDLVDLAWTRDVDLDVRAEPVDLDGDGTPDVRVTRRLRAPGGILGSPETFGLVRTPEDPRGARGRITASTGVLGLREELDEGGKPTGRIGMTCWLCHGGRDPVDGHITYGLVNPAFDYGALLATARVLDDGDPAAARRSTPGYPPGRTVRARLLLGGPGRQDLTAEFGLDRSVPGYLSARFSGTAHLRQGARGVWNPLSVPAILAWPYLDTQNWSASESARDPWPDRLAALAGTDTKELPALFDLPAGDETAARRALLLDLRNLGTLGLQQDSYPGLLWAEAMRGRATVPPAAARRIPDLYAARFVRALIADPDTLARPKVDAAAVARGEALFSERVVGSVRNLRVLKTVPAAYAAAKIAAPVLAPIDASRPLDALMPVRCGDCHVEGGAYSGGRVLPFDADGDGVAQGDEADDARAGGIGTEALLAFDVPKPERPFSLELPLIADADHAGPIKTVKTGVTWVRVAPLRAVFATAPYLHNGSVPTLRALLDPPARRPTTFAVGHKASAYRYDTRLPGNRNIGHEYGTTLTPKEKDDLVAFLMTL